MSQPIAKRSRCSHILVVVESPAKCARIQTYLDNHFGAETYKVVASKGHIYCIDGLQAIDKKKFLPPKYSVAPEKRKVVDELQRQVDIAASVVLATDGDREGEAIAHHICTCFGLDVQTTPRIVFHEITADAVVHAMQHPRTVDMHLVEAQQTRAVLDIIVGYKLSPLLWKYIVPTVAAADAPAADATNEKSFSGNNNRKYKYKKKTSSASPGALSAGRCQTAALRLVYDNDVLAAAASTNANVDADVPETCYKVYGHFVLPVQNSGALPALEMRVPLRVGAETMRQFLEESLAFQHELLLVGTGVEKRTLSPPRPFNTSDLIETAGTTLRMSPREVMDLCQTLYTDGLITYMRTDSRKMNETFINAARKYAGPPAAATKVARPEHFGYLVSSVAAAEAHECIRPTTLRIDAADHHFTGRHKSLYRLIFRRSIEACADAAELQGLRLRVTCPPCPTQEDNYWYEGVVEYYTNIGWKAISGGGSANNDSQRALYHRIEDLVATNQKPIPLKCARIEASTALLDSANKNKVSYFSEHSLVRRLEEMGIGRPSTFSSIVDVLQKRGYVAKRREIPGTVVQCTDFTMIDKTISCTVAAREFGKQSNKLVICPLGVRVLRFLLQYFEPIFDYQYTSNMELALDRIAAAAAADAAADTDHISGTEECRRCYQFLRAQMSPLTQMTKNIDNFALDADHRIVFSLRAGPVIQYTDPSSGETRLKSIKPGVDIDIIRLCEGGYKLDDLLQVGYLGQYEDQPMHLRHGKYGYYLEWGDGGDARTSLRNANIGRPIDQITLAEAIGIVSAAAAAPASQPEKGNNNNILRVVNDDLSVRNGKWGAYLFHKTKSMNRPKMISLKPFRDGYLTCPAELLVAFANR